MINNVDPSEIEHFAKDSSQWWDEEGPFAPLHRMNPKRMEFIRDAIAEHFALDPQKSKPLAKLKILDIGCGGGLICEPLARLGAKVTGIDADENAIAVAQEHAVAQGLEIGYECTTSENIPARCQKSFDVVLALEIIEHVPDIGRFIASAAVLCKPGGLLVFSTLNRTAKSMALGIIAAEYILRWVPAGTHNWKKFVKPSELVRHFDRENLKSKHIKGLIYNPLKRSFEISDNDMDVNYFITAEKLS